MFRIFPHRNCPINLFLFVIPQISVNLYKEYTSLESRELEELPRFGVMTWQPFQLP